VTPDALLQAFPALYLVSMALLGLIVGSFLNVVILRVPVMMERQWRRECELLLADSDTDRGTSAGDSTPGDDEPYSLAFPASHCPKCHAPVRAWQNIPVLSYVLLRGRCASCAVPIGLRYPFVELLTGAATVAAAMLATDWLALLALLLLTWSLIALSGIDIDTQLLPDDITLPLLWAGLLYNLFFGSVPIADAVLGAAAGYLLLWSVYWLFRLVTGKEGMGFGDFKLLAALGAWLGWQSLPLIILLSSLVGACIGIGMIVLLGRDRAQPLPFGPYLAAAGWITLLWGDALMALLFPTVA
jgi:leader peptidase (prepilin peptidase)/N-methyltransferase